jgi:DNA-directed RNA polymerase alpha subunit
MKVKVNILQNDDHSLNFELKNVNVSLANAIRRTIISDIPTVVFDEKIQLFIKILQD